MSNVKGEKTEIVVIPYDYLDDWEYEIEVMTETLYQRGKSLDMAVETEKLTAVTTMFPEIFMQNQKRFFGKLMRQFGDNPENYEIPEGQPAMPGQPGPEGQDLGALTSPVQQLPALSGT